MRGVNVRTWPAVPGVNREGLGGSKHAGVTGWHVEIDYGRACGGSVDLWAMLVQRGGWWQKKAGASQQLCAHASDGQCLSCRVYLWPGHPSLQGGGGHRMYTTLAGFNMGLVSDGRWQRRRCICTGQSAIGGANDLDTRRTPFPLILAIH